MIHDPTSFSGDRPETTAAAAGAIFAAAVSPGASETPDTSETGGMEAHLGRTLARSTNQNAMEQVLALRVRQIEQFGHTPESDAATPLRHFAQELSRAAQAFTEDVQFNKPVDHMQRHLIKLGALTLAAIDRVAITQPDADFEGSPEWS